MNQEISNSIEISSSIEKLESKREGSVNLTALSFEFCEDGLVLNFYDKKLYELGDKEKWMEENQEKLKQNKEKIAKAVKDGLIADSQPETIWQFQMNEAIEGKEKVIAIKSELENRVDEIKDEVVKRLGRFLPNWSSAQAKIVFTTNEKADFCIDNDIITVDLGRLPFEQDPLERVKEGVTHEVFHLWMSEKSKWYDAEQDEVSDQDLKERIMFRTVDEGLAILVSGQSLEHHHIKQGRSFAEYTEESFKSFNDFLSEKDRKKIEKIEDEEFKNMGHFYVVGNEIAKAILQHNGIERFRELIVNAKDNSLIFLQGYGEICDKNTELPKINS